MVVVTESVEKVKSNTSLISFKVKQAICVPSIPKYS